MTTSTTRGSGPIPRSAPSITGAWPSAERAALQGPGSPLSVSSSAQRQGPGPSKESRATARQAVRMPQTFRICHFPGNCSPPSSPLTPVLSLPEEEGGHDKQTGEAKGQQKSCLQVTGMGNDAYERREEEQGRPGPTPLRWQHWPIRPGSFLPC